MLLTLLSPQAVAPVVEETPLPSSSGGGRGRHRRGRRDIPAWILDAVAEQDRQWEEAVAYELELRDTLEAIAAERAAQEVSEQLFVEPPPLLEEPPMIEAPPTLRLADMIRPDTTLPTQATQQADEEDWLLLAA